MPWHKKVFEYDKDRVRHEQRGLIGNDAVYDGVHYIEEHFNYNGSGPKAFGGAQKWPVLTVHIAFTVGVRRERIQYLIKKLKHFIDTEVVNAS